MQNGGFGIIIDAAEISVAVAVAVKKIFLLKQPINANNCLNITYYKYV